MTDEGTSFCTQLCIACAWIQGDRFACYWNSNSEDGPPSPSHCSVNYTLTTDDLRTAEAAAGSGAAPGWHRGTLCVLTEHPAAVAAARATRLLGPVHHLPVTVQAALHRAPVWGTHKERSQVSDEGAVREGRSDDGSGGRGLVSVMGVRILI